MKVFPGKDIGKSSTALTLSLTQLRFQPYYDGLTFLLPILLMMNFEEGLISFFVLSQEEKIILIKVFVPLFCAGLFERSNITLRKHYTEEILEG